MDKQKGVTKDKSANSVMAKSDDGSIQITFTIPYSDIEKSRSEVVKELAKNIDVPGFRKGQAPLDKVEEKIPENTLLEKTLSGILPALLADAIKKYSIRPALYPKFELIKAQPNEDWEIRAVTCELPEITLGNYKQTVSGSLKASSIWTPTSSKTKEGVQDKEPSREEREQKAIKALLEAVPVKIPKLLIDEEANSRLSKLLERLEKLGLSLESYLASVGKTAVSVRQEYEDQAKATISLDLILTKIAEAENLKADSKEVDQAIETGKSDPNLATEFETPERRRFIEVILARRKALDFLTSLV